MALLVQSPRLRVTALLVSQSPSRGHGAPGSASGLASGVAKRPPGPVAPPHGFRGLPCWSSPALVGVARLGGGVRKRRRGWRPGGAPSPVTAPPGDGVPGFPVTARRARRSWRRRVARGPAVRAAASGARVGSGVGIGVGRSLAAASAASACRCVDALLEVRRNSFAACAAHVPANRASRVCHVQKTRLLLHCLRSCHSN